ncbi:hypothetical protein Ddc_14065 [Ditylenchus destructor]|nr:hypothetical protein Ddc_14065 [Ditylenchus destructor]
MVDFSAMESTTGGGLIHSFCKVHHHRGGLHSGKSTPVVHFPDTVHHGGGLNSINDSANNAAHIQLMVPHHQSGDSLDWERKDQRCLLTSQCKDGHVLERPHQQ